MATEVDCRMHYNFEQWIWRSWLRLWVKIVCWIPLPERGVRHGNPDRKSWPCSYIYDGTDVQVDWKRSCTGIRSGSRRHRHFVTCPSKHRHGATLCIRLFRESGKDTLGIILQKLQNVHKICIVMCKATVIFFLSSRLFPSCYCRFPVLSISSCHCVGPCVCLEL